MSAVNYRDAAIEIVPTRGNKIRRIAVGSEGVGAQLVEALRTKLRTTTGASGRQSLSLKSDGVQYAEPTPIITASGTPDEEPRFCYIRQSKLIEYYSDPVVITALLAQLQVPGLAATLKRLTDHEKQEEIERHIEGFRQSQTSIWSGVPTYEVIAASIWRARGGDLRTRLVEDKFYKVSEERDLRRPIAKWLTAHEYEPYMEIPAGRRIIDALGYKKAGLMGSPRLVAVQLKNDDAQFKRGPDQMGTFAEYAHAVYLACTPAFAADYLERNAHNPNVGRWDHSLLDRKLKQGGFELLIVERDNVFEIIKPVERTPSAANVSRLVAGLSRIQRIDLD